MICPMRDVVQFLTECFQKGFKYNTIAGFGSANSAYHDPIQGISVGKLLGFLTLWQVSLIKKPKPKFNVIQDDGM